MLGTLLDRIRPGTSDASDRERDGRASGPGPGSGSDPPSESDPDTESGKPAESDDGTLWDLIPRWQYRGRHVETGGATKDEQERALEEIEAQADAIEATESAHLGDDGHDR